MIDFIIRGGVVMWFIVALAFIATAIIIERLLYLRRISKDEVKLFKYAKTSLQQGHYQERWPSATTTFPPSRRS